MAQIRKVYLPTRASKIFPSPAEFAWDIFYMDRSPSRAAASHSQTPTPMPVWVAILVHNQQFLVPIPLHGAAETEAVSPPSSVSSFRVISVLFVRLIVVLLLVTSDVVHNVTDDL